MAQSSQTTWFHRLAVSTVWVAMITLVFGALTTSKNAGMAFRDWPTSDGHAMVTYPWFDDFAQDWDKFLEHGHRLAGMLIGLWSIALVAMAFKTQQRKSVKLLSIGVLVGVICQGLLGGFRVQLDERGLAMLHGAFAAIVFSLMGSVVLLSGAKWADPESETDRSTMTILKVLSVILVVLLLVQYLLGGLIRHQGTGLYEHLVLGLAVLAVIFVNFIYSISSDSALLRGSGALLLAIVFCQVVLGLGTWVLKFGYTPLGYVAINDSIHQVVSRTTHTVWGIITFQAAFVHLLKVFRVASLSHFSEPEPIVIRSLSQSLAVEGGQE